MPSKESNTEWRLPLGVFGFGVKIAIIEEIDVLLNGDNVSEFVEVDPDVRD